jgi:hypothetical protein
VSAPAAVIQDWKVRVHAQDFFCNLSVLCQEAGAKASAAALFSTQSRCVRVFATSKEEEEIERMKKVGRIARLPPMQSSSPDSYLILAAVSRCGFTR